MAQRTPDNHPTIGILRIPTTITEFAIDNTMKSSLTGGSSPWNPNKYLNIWVCKLSQNYLGYAQYPGGNDTTDGVVIDYRVFGTVGALKPNYQYGRTAVHEVGHWLNLLHPWGEGETNTDCTGTDFVNDTPVTAGPIYYCPNAPHTSHCNSTGEMFMNYMDYVYDYCFNLFTLGQTDRMWASINIDRPGLLTSDGCSPYIGIEEHSNLNNLVIEPNPTDGIAQLRGIPPGTGALHIVISDITGKIVANYDLYGDGPINLQNLVKGMYFVRIISKNEIKAMKVIRL